MIVLCAATLMLLTPAKLPDVSQRLDGVMLQPSCGSVLHARKSESLLGSVSYV